MTTRVDALAIGDVVTWIDPGQPVPVRKAATVVNLRPIAGARVVVTMATPAGSIVRTWSAAGLVVIRAEG